MTPSRPATRLRPGAGRQPGAPPRTRRVWWLSRWSWLVLITVLRPGTPWPWGAGWPRLLAEDLLLVWARPAWRQPGRAGRRSSVSQALPSSGWRRKGSRRRFASLQTTPLLPCQLDFVQACAWSRPTTRPMAWPKWSARRERRCSSLAHPNAPGLDGSSLAQPPSGFSVVTHRCRWRWLHATTLTACRMRP